MFSQLFGLNLATPSLWRYVFLISFGLSGLQIVATAAVVESPTFLSRRKLHEEQTKSVRRLWANGVPSTSREDLQSSPIFVVVDLL
jgi:CCR4-NOT transcription complex subunit 1